MGAPSFASVHKTRVLTGVWPIGKGGMLDGGSSVGYWRHGKAPDIFCRIRERDACAARAGCCKHAGGARCSGGEARRAARIGAKRDAARRGRPREDRAVVAYSVALFCTGNLLGLGVATALLAAVASGRPRRTSAARRSLRLSHCRLPARLQRCSLSGWLAGIAVALSGCFCWYGRVFAHGAFHARKELSRGCAACSPLWVAWACPYATSRRRFPSLCGSCRCFPRS